MIVYKFLQQGHRNPDSTLKGIARGVYKAYKFSFKEFFLILMLVISPVYRDEHKQRKQNRIERRK